MWFKLSHLFKLIVTISFFLQDEHLTIQFIFSALKISNIVLKFYRKKIKINKLIKKVVIIVVINKIVINNKFFACF